MSGLGHGSVGTREQTFTNLLPLRAAGYPAHELAKLADSIKNDGDDVKDGPDTEENILMPAGYTYLGQFIDHDLTFDNTSSLNPADSGREDRFPGNLRTPRFDLDSVYGDGPDAQPFMYAADGASLLYKHVEGKQSPTNYEQATNDLLRSPNGRAIIGDKRNDENSIISQIQLVFVRYHNAVVVALKTEHPAMTGTELFNRSRDQVRWAYQKIVVEDFLPRLVNPAVLADLRTVNVEANPADRIPATPNTRADRYALYTLDKRGNLPREFVVAAFRYGHSGVREGYRLNGLSTQGMHIFAPSDKTVESEVEDPTKSLLGFNPMPKSHVIDNWGRFFPTTLPGVLPSEDRHQPQHDNPAVRLQFAYKLDTTIVDPLSALPLNIMPTSGNPGGAVGEAKDAISPLPLPPPGRPSLALLNLLRGNTYKIQGGQAIAHALKEKGFPVQTLAPKHLCTRHGVDGKDGICKFAPIAKVFQTDTPLWFYVLAEAQAPIVEALGLNADGSPKEFNEDLLLTGVGAKTQLGWVGGRIIAEVFYGLLDSDSESYVNAAPKDWKPKLGGDKSPIFANLIKFVS